MKTYAVEINYLTYHKEVVVVSDKNEDKARVRAKRIIRSAPRDADVEDLFILETNVKEDINGQST